MLKNESAKGAAGPLPLMSLNHISLLCRCVEDSASFYQDVLGFVPVRRPECFDFGGAWLFNYGVGIHLLRCANPDDLPKKTEINPRDNHISFQCEDMQAVERKLQETNIKYVKRIVEEGGIYVDQLFFHDPDGFMIEICNCENLPVEPLGSPACLNLPSHPGTPPMAIQRKGHTPSQYAVCKPMFVSSATSGAQQL